MSKVPYEYLNRARAYREAVCTAGFAMNSLLHNRIAPKLKARLPKKPSLREDHANEIVNLWQESGIPYRVGFASEYQKGHLRVEEVRLAGSNFCDAGWESMERGIAFIRIALHTERRGFEIKIMPFVLISTHAIARWFERTRSLDEDTLWTDLQPLLTSIEDRVSVGDGCWQSVRTVANDAEDGKEYRVRSVRTYLETPWRVSDYFEDRPVAGVG